MHPFYLSILVHLQLLLGFASSQITPPYTPTDLILLSCGGVSGDQIGLDGRTWSPDSTSEFVPRDKMNNNGISSPSTPNEDMHTSVSQIPYSNARIFRSNFTYSFKVSSGPMFLRLYFYPNTYGDVDMSTHFFSVTANGYTLLRNFSASLWLAPDQFSISKEFIVCSGDDGELKVTFIPYPNSYAFVNAIEVGSMPNSMYSHKDYNPNTTGLETVHRVNVGGSNVLPQNDTGMFRAWTQDQGITNYTRTPSFLSPLPIDLSIDYNDKDTPEYTAPEAVYRTSRVMGGDPEENLRYNLTWTLPVEPGFSYLVRLHFCETQAIIDGPKEKMFNIYISDQKVEEALDVYSSAGGKGVPIHRDYVAFVSGTDLGLALHPYTEPTGFRPLFNDVILNGVEVFKMSGPDRSLAGLNPDPRPPSDRAPGSPPARVLKRPSHVPIFAGVSGGVLGLLSLSLLLCFFIFRRSRRNYLDRYKKGTTSWDPFSTTTKSTKSRGGSSLPSDLCRHFTIAEIKSATNNFDQTFVIGAGGFGNVYKGTIDTDTGPTPVAIKRLNPGSKQGLHEFLTEIDLLTRLRHLHLVSLIGFCEDDNEMILVYDYMSRGTLRDHLYNTQNPTLNWTQRLEICIGAARGLQYLHTGAKHTIIHRDVKTTNILIDEKYVAKVSDFGLSRIGSTSVTKAHVTTVVKGSFGYLDPEYFKRQQLTEKSDVYSFGVVLCEVISARPPLNVTAEKRRVNLAEWARECYRRGTIESLVDAKLKGKIALESLNKYVEIAMKCLGDKGSERPSMGDVVWGLEFVLELQKTADKRANGEEDQEEVESDDLWDESVTATTEVTTVVGSSISGERSSMN